MPGSRYLTVASTTVAPGAVVDTVVRWDAMGAVACASVEEGVARGAVAPDVVLLVSPSAPSYIVNTLRFIMG